MMLIRPLENLNQLYDGKTSIYLKIEPIDGMTAYERGIRINQELFNIQNVGIENQGQQLFPVYEYENNTEIEYYMSCLMFLPIKVSPNANLNPLISLFPNLSDEEKTKLIEFIKRNKEFKFIEILPSDTEIFYGKFVDL